MVKAKPVTRNEFKLGGAKMKASALAIVLILPYTWGTSIPRTYYVSPTGSATYPFSTPETAATVIQDAVDAAQYGDVVQLMPGEYGQTVELKDGMSLWGCGADCTTIIALEGAPDAAAVSAAQAAEIRRIRFVREASGVSPAPYAIRLGASGNHVVAHCAFYGLAMDLYWRATGPALVYDCTFEGRGAGVGLGFDAGMIVDSCRFSRAYVGGAGVLLLRRCTFAE